MSLLDIVVREDRAFVVVDTETAIAPALDPTGAERARLRAAGIERFAGSKAFIVPHVNAVVTLRGSCPLLATVAMSLCTAPLAAFDDLIDMLAETVRRNHELLAVGPAVHTIDDEQSVFAVGWSDREQQMVLAAANRQRGTSRYVLDDGLMTHTSPWPFAERAPLAASADELLELARSQIRRVKAFDSEVALGGALVMFELTRDTLSMRRHPVAAAPNATPY